MFFRQKDWKLAHSLLSVLFTQCYAVTSP